MVLRTAIDSLAAVLFPAPCRICDATLLMASRVPIGAACFAWFEPIRQPMCALWQAVPHPTSRRIRSADLPPLSRQLRHLRLRPQLRRLQGRAASRHPLAEIRGSHSLWGRGVPVRLHPDRQRERRYNQGELIARPLARRPHLNEGAYLLMRTKPRPAGALSQRALGPGTCRLRYSQGPAG